MFTSHSTIIFTNILTHIFTTILIIINNLFPIPSHITEIIISSDYDCQITKKNWKIAT